MKKIFLMIAAIFFVAQTFAQVCVYDRQTGTIKIYRNVPRVVTVNSTGKRVQFAKGNLQYNKSTDKWSFMMHQYDIVETNGMSIGTNYANQNIVSLFGWGTSGWDNGNRTAYQPYATSSNNAHYGVKSTKSSDETLTGTYANGDWGVYNADDLGTGWRTLTKDEWKYVILDRTPGNSVNEVPNARYAKAIINTDGTPVKGFIIFPDNANLTTVTGVTWGDINNASDWTTTCTQDGWDALEAAGCIFLPAAGHRVGETVELVGDLCAYWASSAYSSTYAYRFFANSANIGPTSYLDRYRGYSVRLVMEVE